MMRIKGGKTYFKVLIVVKGRRTWLEPLFSEILVRLKDMWVIKIDLLCHREESSHYSGPNKINRLFFFPERFRLARLREWIDLAGKIHKQNYDYLAILQDNYFGFGYVRLYLFTLLASGAKRGIYKYCGPVEGSMPVKEGNSGLDSPCQGRSILWNLCLLGFIPLSQGLLILSILFFGIYREFRLFIRRSIGISPSYPPRKMTIMLVEGTLEIGGDQRLQSLITEGLVKRGHKVIAVGLNSGPYYAKLLKAGASRVVLHDQHGEIHKIRWLMDMNLVREIFHIIRKERIDVVHVYGLTGNRIALLPALIACTSRIIGNQTAGDVVIWNKYELFLRALMAKFMDAIYVDSYKEIEEMNATHISREKCAKINTGFDFQQLGRLRSRRTTKVRKEFSIPEDAIILGTATRFVSRKGVQNIVKAAPKVVDKHPKVIFLLVGDGILRAELEKLVHDLGLNGHVIFTGFRTDAPRLTSAMDIFVHPSWGDTNSISILTAMALGKPVIGAEAERYMGKSEPLTNGETGIVLRWNDVESLSNAMIQLIEDHALRQRLGASARKYVRENYSLKNMIDIVETLYRQFQ